jgi:hypothetical protein
VGGIYILDEVYVVVEVVGGRQCEIDLVGQFWPAKPKFDLHRLNINGRLELNRGVGGIYIQDEGYVVVEAVGGRQREIDQGGRFWPAKPKFDLRRLDISGRLKFNHGVGGIYMLDEEYAVLEVVGGRQREIDPEGWFWPAKPKFDLRRLDISERLELNHSVGGIVMLDAVYVVVGVVGGR